MTERQIRRTLEQIRRAIRAESVSTFQLVELQAYAGLITPGDVELLEPAGVPEGMNPRVYARLNGLPVATF